MKSEVEERQFNVEHRRVQGHSVEYRANVVLIAFNPLHLWGFWHWRALSHFCFVLNLWMTQHEMVTFGSKVTHFRKEENAKNSKLELEIFREMQTWLGKNRVKLFFVEIWIPGW